MTHLISTTMRPDQVVEVEDTEYVDLERQGLVLVDHTEPAEKASATTKKAAATATNKEG